MRQLTDEVHWRGIGGPDDMSKVLLVPFAASVREHIEQHFDRVFERKKGSAAATRGKGASGWHLYNCTIPSLVEQPTPFVNESDGGSTSTQE